MPTTQETRDAAALLRRLGRALHRLERSRICCGTITRQQFETLRLVHEAGSLGTSEIAVRLGIDLSTASRNLAVLERERCLARRSQARDARRVCHEVTARGRACLEELCREERDTLCAALEDLPRSARSAVFRALGQLAPALERAVSCEGSPTRGASKSGANAAKTPIPLTAARRR